MSFDFALRQFPTRRIVQCLRVILNITVSLIWQVRGLPHSYPEAWGQPGSKFENEISSLNVQIKYNVLKISDLWP